MSDKPEATIIAPEKVLIEYSLNEIQQPESFARLFVKCALKGDIITAALLANQAGTDTDENKIAKIESIISVLTEELHNNHKENVVEEIYGLIGVFSGILNEVKERNKEPTNDDNKQEGEASIQDE